MKEIYNGKSKILFSDGNGDCLRMRFKNEMRAADGRHFVMAEKGRILADISARIFGFLEGSGIATHFLGRVDEETLKVIPLKMLPLECVVRRYAEGSYLKRNDGARRHERFEEPVFEIFFKDDGLDDPFVVYDPVAREVSLHNQKKDVGDGSLLKKLRAEDLLPRGCQLGFETVHEKLGKLSRAVFILLENKFKENGCILCDLKLEYGMRGDELYLADSIEPDGWRLWYGDAANNLDRNDGYGVSFSADVVAAIKSKYAKAAEVIKKIFPL